MKDEKINLSLDEPQLPKALSDARRNHGGMTVPDGFFTQFERKMNAVIDAEVMAHGQDAAAESPRPAVLNWRRWASIAAAVVVVVALSLVVRMQNGSDASADSPSSLAALGEGNSAEAAEVQDQIEDGVMAAVSDYDVFDLYCDL